MTGVVPATGPVSRLPSACPLDCPDACSLDVVVQDGRVLAIEGSERNPITRPPGEDSSAFICGKVRRFDRRLEHAARLTRPLLRDPNRPKGSGAFRPVSWDQALELVAKRLREVRDDHGGEAIYPLRYGGSNGRLTDGCLDEALWARLGTSRQLFSVCAAATGAASRGLYGGMPGVAFDDYEHARLIVVWGANPHASHIHLVPWLKRAKERGAELVVVDPRRTKVAKLADQHLALRPGTDLVLALAVIRWMFEEGAADRAFLGQHTTGAEELERRARPWTSARAAEVAGVEAADIERFARSYAEASPALIRCGWGQERNRNGGSATAAILALPAVGGKFGQRGGGFTLSNSGAFQYRTALESPPRLTRELDMNRLGRDLLERDDPRIRLLFAYDINPLMTLPEQELVRRGLAREDLFTVVFEQVMTDTARYADVVLPATTFLEHHELSNGYGALCVQRSRPVIDPIGESRPNYEVFGELLRRCQLWTDADTTDPDELVARQLDPDLHEGLAADGIAAPIDGDHPVLFANAFPRTSDRKVHLVPRDLDEEAPLGLYGYQPDPATAEFPLALISPATAERISSTFGELHRDEVPLGLHPEDAAARGIAGGDTVRVFNASGEVLTSARLDPDLRPGVALLPKGLWSHNTRNQATANALVPDTAADLGRAACFNDARVEVERVEPGRVE